MDISAALTALEQLASSTSTSSSGPLNALLDEHFSLARQRLLSGDEDPRVVITDLQKSVVKAKKDVEKGLKAWYAGLGHVGKAVEKVSGLSLATFQPFVMAWYGWVRAESRARHSRPTSLPSPRPTMTPPCSLILLPRMLWTAS
jgi:hypothetical protein